MVPRQLGKVVWATGVVIKWIRVWLHQLLPPPLSPLMLLGILLHILLHCLRIILRLMFHFHLLVIWVRLRLRLILNNNTTWPASPTPGSLNYTLCRLSMTVFPLSPNGCVTCNMSSNIIIHTCNMHNTTGFKFSTKKSIKKKNTGLSGFHFPNCNNLVRKTKSGQLQYPRKKERNSN